MKKNRPDLPNIVIEFKKAKSELEIETKLKEGMKQIKDKQYYKGMSVPTIISGGYFYENQ